MQLHNTSIFGCETKDRFDICLSVRPFVFQGLFWQLVHKLVHGYSKIDCFICITFLSRQKENPTLMLDIFNWSLRFRCLRFWNLRFRNLRFRNLRFQSLRFQSLRFWSLRFWSLRFWSLQLWSCRFRSTSLYQKCQSYEKIWIKMSHIRVGFVFCLDHQSDSWRRALRSHTHVRKK